MRRSLEDEARRFGVEDGAGDDPEGDEQGLKGQVRAFSVAQLQAIAAEHRALTGDDRGGRWADVAPRAMALGDMRAVAPEIAKALGKRDAQLLRAFKRARRERGIEVTEGAGGG